MVVDHHGDIAPRGVATQRHAHAGVLHHTHVREVAGLQTPAQRGPLLEPGRHAAEFVFRFGFGDDLLPLERDMSNEYRFTTLLRKGRAEFLVETLYPITILPAHEGHVATFVLTAQLDTQLHCNMFSKFPKVTCFDATLECLVVLYGTLRTCDVGLPSLSRFDIGIIFGVLPRTRTWNNPPTFSCGRGHAFSISRRDTVIDHHHNQTKQRETCAHS